MRMQYNSHWRASVRVNCFRSRIHSKPEKVFQSTSTNKNKDWKISVFSSFWWVSVLRIFRNALIHALTLKYAKNYFFHDFFFNLKTFRNFFRFKVIRESFLQSKDFFIFFFKPFFSIWDHMKIIYSHFGNDFFNSNSKSFQESFFKFKDNWKSFFPSEMLWESFEEMVAEEPSRLKTKRKKRKKLNSKKKSDKIEAISIRTADFESANLTRFSPHTAKWLYMIT